MHLSNYVTFQLGCLVKDSKNCKYHTSVTSCFQLLVCKGWHQAGWYSVPGYCAQPWTGQHVSALLKGLLNKILDLHQRHL